MLVFILNNRFQILKKRTGAIDVIGYICISHHNMYNNFLRNLNCQALSGFTVISNISLSNFYATKENQFLIPRKESQSTRVLKESQRCMNIHKYKIRDVIYFSLSLSRSFCLCAATRALIHPRVCPYLDFLLVRFD